MAETITVRGDGVVLDLLLWRRFGVRGRELVELTLDLNPGLAAVGPILPHGTVVVLPETLPQSAPAPRRIVSLFG